ncbi:hypothetical protein FRUB_03913 [Fimbriiglobus ruber]|uniref:Uncharacterized protein n=1 Tax=Fimbriiglobus ruber TaxID=1908690 RepID=A0A225DZN7_9BACT|nr:hypothetical protein FRUB_03913 [Fimbriiglobus ruber]
MMAAGVGDPEMGLRGRCPRRHHASEPHPETFPVPLDSHDNP